MQNVVMLDVGQGFTRKGIYIIDASMVSGMDCLFGIKLLIG